MGDAGIKSAIQGSNVFFFFNDTATTEIYTTHNTLSLHDALPIYREGRPRRRARPAGVVQCTGPGNAEPVLEIGRAHV